MKSIEIYIPDILFFWKVNLPESTKFASFNLSNMTSVFCVSLPMAG